MISDLQIPFEAERALEFCVYLAKHYKIPKEHILNVGDELDCYHGGRWPKDPDGKFSASGELATSKAKLREWYEAFPEMKLAISNHGLRWVRKASGAEIPSQLMRSYQEIIEAPPGWEWRPRWKFDTKHPFHMIHGMGYSGKDGHRNAAIDSGASTVIGHLHSHAGISYLRTGDAGAHHGGLKIWAANAGCLIDPTQYAFDYGKESRFKPAVGCLIIFNQGSTPMWVPYD